jgi:ferrous iron transport protein B
VLLVGNPNVGKSALFGALTGRYVNVSNFPGTTVEITRGRLKLGREPVSIVDTPGANSLLPTSDDERVTRDLLLEGGHGAVIAVGDAKNVVRSISLAVQLCEAGVPFVLALNMVDEARGRGLHVDVDRLTEALGVEVVPTVAVRGEGIADLLDRLPGARHGRLQPIYPEPIETALKRIAPLLPGMVVRPRALALMALGGDAPLLERLRRTMSARDFATLERQRERLEGQFGEPLSYVINRVRLEFAGEVAERVHRTSTFEGIRARGAARLDAATIHPLLGLPILALVLWLCYRFVGVFGAGTMVDLLESRLFGEWINPGVTGWFDRLIPGTLVRDLFVGEYGLLTMALTYSLALVLPIVGTFFVAFGVLEDSGYLPRLAVMVNRAMRTLGLNGKAVLPMVLGLGCDTMATLTTRIMETRRERMIVILLLALGIPCSAQLTVILAMLATVGPLAMGIWLAVVLAVILVVGRLAHRLFPGRRADFLLELPPLRMPRPGNILVKTLARLEWYLKEAVPLFMLGTLVLFVADRLHLLGKLERAAEPLLQGFLGLPRETAASFVIGFLRRDFGAAGLYHMLQEGRLDGIQVVVAVVTITLFIPCIANFFMIVKERGSKTGLAVAAFIFPFAVLVGAGLNVLLRAVPVAL